MNKPSHHFSELFAQLGLANDDRSIAQFLSNYTGRSQGVRLPDAPFWTRSQAAFLRESLSQDSDWTGLVDQLSKALRDTAGQGAEPSVVPGCNDLVKAQLTVREPWLPSRH